MRKPVLVAAFLLAVPNVGTSAPLCVPDTLAGYAALASGGCNIGGATFFDFTSAASFFGGSEIAASAISVNPLLTATGPQLEFGVAAAAGSGEIVGVLVGYSVAGLSFAGATLDMTGAAAAFPGAVTAVEDLCLDGAFGPDVTICSGTPAALIVAQDFLGSTGPDSNAFAAAFFDVFLDLTIDAGGFGSASLNGTVTNHFAAAPVPEPSAFVLIGSGLVALCARRRRTLH